MPAKIYVALSVFQSVIDEVKAYRSKASSERFINTFERSQEIENERECKHQREYEDTYATWYECELKD